MRRGIRRHAREEEEESAFVSMTDMTVSFLFIMMILLAFFASRFNPEETVPKSDHDAALATIASQGQKIDAQKDEINALKGTIEELLRRLAIAERPNPLEAYIAQTASERRNILKRLRDQLLAEFPDLNVVISAENDALRFQGDGLFNSGSAAFRNQHTIQVVQRIAARLGQILPCYTLGRASAWNNECNSNGAIIEAVQIEGHTDSTDSDINNLRLSTERAITTFAEMTGREPALVDHLNYRQQPVLSVAGYGEMRPTTTNQTTEGRATNRRIDLRIIMFTPGSTEEIERIRIKLQSEMGFAKP